jgi:hypothetical protein
MALPVPRIAGSQRERNRHSARVLHCYGAESLFFPAARNALGQEEVVEMFSQSPFRRKVVSRILGISALFAVIVAVGCASNKGGGGTPSLAATVASLGSFSSGEQGAAYSITVSNTGTAATSGPVTVAGLPTGFTATGFGGPLWACTLATVTCTNINSLPPGQSFYKIIVTGNVTSPNGTPVIIPLVLSGGGTPAVTVAPRPSIAVAAPTCPLPKLGNESLLSSTSPYVVALNGWADGEGPSQAVGAFLANGTGASLAANWTAVKSLLGHSSQPLSWKRLAAATKSGRTITAS